MKCRKCGGDIAFTGPAPYVSRVAGIGYLAPIVHTATGREDGDADGHTATPPFDAGLRLAA